jgi:circadian clock protein KaiA
MTIAVSPGSHTPISVFALLRSAVFLTPVQEILDCSEYTMTWCSEPTDFFSTIDHDPLAIDCLILEQTPEFIPVVRRLHREATLLPVVVLAESLPSDATPLSNLDFDGVWYHTAEVKLNQQCLTCLPQSIDSAITQFLKLSAKACASHVTVARSPSGTEVESRAPGTDASASEDKQQLRLADKLKERLGYIGIYYKRDAQQFFRNLPQEEQAEFLDELNSEYRSIVLNYFRKENDVNHRIDEFVNRVFFADMSVSQVLEIHMALMDQLSKRLKLERRSEEILLDYRLTLIDTIAHLCEMYRRSIPREP